jgi:hypothetical protein
MTQRIAKRSGKYALPLMESGATQSNVKQIALVAIIAIAAELARPRRLQMLTGKATPAVATSNKRPMR